MNLTAKNAKKFLEIHHSHKYHLCPLTSMLIRLLYSSAFHEMNKNDLTLPLSYVRMLLMSLTGTVCLPYMSKISHLSA